MKATSELFFLTLIAITTGLMWLPYVLARIRTRGVSATMGNPDAELPQSPVWAQRAQLAHSNAIENLAVFASLVLAAAVAGISTPGTVFAAKLYFASRLAHYVVYSAGIPVVRTLCFFGGVGAMLVYAVTIIGHLG